jgi:hypothetical protein
VVGLPRASQIKPLGNPAVLGALEFPGLWVMPLRRLLVCYVTELVVPALVRGLVR